MNKYKVGQSIYWIHQIHGKTELYDDMFVIQRVSIDNIGFHYSLVNSHEDIIDWCREEDLFADKKVAELECRKRNALKLLKIY